MSSDTLFTVRNSFYIGAYQAAIAEAADLDTLSALEKVERDVFVYRSYIELGSYELVISEVSASSPQALQAVKLLAKYFGGKEDKATTLNTVQEWMEDPQLQTDDHALLAAAIIQAKEGNDVEALKACHAGQSLELMAISIQLLLKMHRVDQAQERLKAMVSNDEDSTLTQLAAAWIDIGLGGAKAEKASFIIWELGDRYNWTVRLLNAKAVCLMRMDRCSEALEVLQEAYEKDVKNAETLANLVTASLLSGKSSSRHISQLRTVAPQHAAIQNLEAAEELFTKAASAY